MNTAELKKLAEAATPGPWTVADRSHIYTPDLRVLAVAQHSRDTASNAAYIAAANPAVILELLAINAELVEALKRCRFDSLNMSLADLEFCRAALARYEGEKE
jgi:hypothetical protein